MRAGGNNNQQEIFWEAGINPHNQASFIEYLRWLRVPNLANDNDDDATKAKLLQNAAERSNNYCQYFQRRNQATKLIAGEGNTFTVECEWRIRVGGMRGPEDMLLPAFDAAGMPYIPSSTLRGVARAQGVRSLVQEKLALLQKTHPNITSEQKQQAKQEAEKEIARYLGSLEATEENRAGKVVFLDAYPCGQTWGQNERGLAVDIANNIWNWEGNQPTYKPNPNLFLSLRKPKFVIGLRPTSQCNDARFQQVKTWLEQGLQMGIGSQINSGYGEINVEGITPISPFLQVNFTLTGQLIHSYQRQNWNREKDEYEGQAEAEVRAIAFKSMLRYWFRAFALGVLPVGEVRDRLEPRLFGAIQPQTQGWVKCQVKETDKPNPRTMEQSRNACLYESGILKLSFSTEAPTDRQNAIQQLFENLTWLMFHLGGVGQGARRPKHSRNSKPYYRGSQLRATGVLPNPNNGWVLPGTPQAFKEQFQTKLRGFYRSLAQLTATNCNTRFPNPNMGDFRELIGRDCKIVVCQGNSNSQKPFALDVLHQLAHLENGRYDRELCGDANSNPSPIWIADLGNYQVVTVFGAVNQERSKFLAQLRKRATDCETLWDHQGIKLN